MEMVILDLETSGLRAREDSIIEVALMRIDDTGKILERYSSLVNPGFVISAEITLLTNITPEDLENAPTIGSIKSTIVNFIGNSPVIGHNVSFDLDFLAENGMFPSNPLVIDTFKIAEILYHGEKSLNLSSLTETLGYTHTDAHRAASDVEATRFLLVEEMALLRNLTPTQGAILARAAVLSRSPMLDWMRSLAPNDQEFRLEGESSQFQAGEFLDDASTDPKESMRRDRRAHSPSWNIFAPYLEHILAREAQLVISNTGFSGTSSKVGGSKDTGKKGSKNSKSPKKHTEKSLPTWSELLALGALEERPEQSRLVAMTLAHMQTAGHLCAEAPTGIGKTFAYLYPAVITALTTGKQVCISTNTKALQDQIEGKDFPRLASLFGQAGIEGLELQKLKGRKNYLSLLAYFEFFDQDELSVTAAILAAKLGFWILSSESGELDEVSLYGEEYGLIEDIHAGDLRVLTPDNPYRDFEPLERARQGVKRAPIIVLNHALLLSEYLEGEESSLLPKFEYLVLDEVHNLEAVATDALKVTSDSSLFEKCVTDITRAIKKHNKLRPLDAFLSPEVTAISESLLMTARILFDEIESSFSLSLMTPAKGSYGGGRAQEALLEVATLEGARDRIYEMLDIVHSRVHDLEQIFFAAPESLTKDVARIFDHLGGLENHIRTFFTPTEGTPLIQIYSAREGQPPRIVSTPLRVGEIMRDRLWSKIPSVVMMSATLTTGGTFDYISRVLELTDFEKVIFETDFDYSKQALLYIPPELPDVAKSEHLRAIQDFLSDLLIVYGGRTLMLFTSFASIKETMLALSARMKREGITMLAQGLGGGKHKLAGEFIKKSNTSVLLGTDSFWEGVDFAGDLLELLVIYKLPFAVPTDPVFVARSRLYSNAFEQYAIPMMTLKFRQGLGRLIRTRTDKGIIVLLDRRVTTSWGSQVLNSLPKGLPVNMSASADFIAALRTRRSGNRDTAQEK